MTWVITRLCIDTVNLDCVEVCPVDCIYQYDGTDKAMFPNQLYIDPEECILCSVCEIACPWEAIFENVDVPEVFQEDTALNAGILGHKNDFSVPVLEEKLFPTAEQVKQNKVKWGYTA
jgi:ferredoxin